MKEEFKEQKKYGEYNFLTKKQMELVEKIEKDNEFKQFKGGLNGFRMFDHLSRHDKNIFYSEPYIDFLSKNNLSDLINICNKYNLDVTIIMNKGLWFPTRTLLLRYKIMGEVKNG